MLKGSLYNEYPKKSIHLNKKLVIELLHMKVLRLAASIEEKTLMHMAVVTGNTHTGMDVYTGGAFESSPWDCNPLNVPQGTNRKY